MSPPGYPNVVSVHLWVEDVARETQLPTTFSHKSTHGMRLRPLPSKPSKTRLPLQESAGNQRYQQRRREKKGLQSESDHGNKRRRTIDDKQLHKKPVGRPRKNATGLDQTGTPDLQPSHNSQGPPSSSSRGRPSLPSKAASPFRKQRGIPSPDHVKPDTALSMKDLQSCQPHIFQMDITRARKRGTVPPAVENLYKTLTTVEYACIPPDLKASYDKETDTPHKTKVSPSDPQYLPGTAIQFPPGRSSRMKQSVETIIKDARWNHDSKAHERNWGKLVSVILFDYETFHSDVLAMNVETCAIAPREIRVQSSSGEPIVVENNITVITSNEGPATPLGRMVDWVLSLRLSDQEIEWISDAFPTYGYAKRSLNQSLTDFFRECPIFLDIEIKKDLSARDPEVQLAIWAGAGLLKKRPMHWSTDLPMPGIIVDGHEWTCYLFFKQGEHLIMLGPIEIGSTKTQRGTWQIYYQLMHLVQWGTKEYRAWFKGEVLGWARSRAGMPVVDDDRNDDDDGKEQCCF